MTYDQSTTDLLRDIFILPDHTDEREINTVIDISAYATCLQMIRRREKDGLENRRQRSGC